MSNNTQELKAAQRREKFAGLLREMFQLDQPELDFGLYRIMHARKDDINRFIEQDLPNIARAAFSEFASLDKAQLEQALEQAKKGATDAGFSPEESPTVKAIQAQLKDNFDLAREEGEVYDALVTFFSRYYSEGDFLSRRVYKDGTYAIPYQGEEVVLHWANKDQYYIKSSETLRDYSFRLNPHAGLGEDPMRVHFKLVDADAGAKDNNKESADNKRVFILDADMPFELIDGEPNEDGEWHPELQLRFFFRPATSADWSDKAKSKASAAGQKKPPTQDHLRTIAEERLLGESGQLPAPWSAALGRLYTKANGERADYSTLQGQLNNYTKKNTFDYFIHKDLGGFLTRELDFYVKNELMDWSDIAALKHDPARLAPLLSKIEVIRNLGEKIITFLAQLENFQKKLWLKKKFVTETNYCITLDRIEQYSNLLHKVFCNERQKQDWVSLYKLDLKQLELDLQLVKDKDCYSEVLRDPKYRYLILDTIYFDDNFKSELLGSIENLDEQCDGLLVHSENFQALNLLQERYRDEAKCIYIDPPYNTDVSSIPYKNSYKHSSWATLMADRVRLLKGLLKPDGALFASIDKHERLSLDMALQSTFGKENFVEELIWSQNTNDGRATTYSTNHEYILTFAKDLLKVESDYDMFREPKPGYAEVTALISEHEKLRSPLKAVELAIKSLYEKHKADYREDIEAQDLDWEVEKRNDPWKGLYNYKHAEYRDTRGSYLTEKEALFNSKNCQLWVYRESDWTIMSSDSKQSATTKALHHKNYRYYTVYHPVTGGACTPSTRGWKGTQYIDPDYPDRNSFESLLNDHRIAFGVDENKVPQQKRFIHEVESNVCKSVFTDYADGEKETTAMFGHSGVFLAPKHSSFVARFIRQTTNQDSLVIDCFGGSGSTAHGVINVNRDDKGKRKFILVEMGAYFDRVLKPRIQKAVYSNNWRAGIPVKYTGVSHAFKHIRLEGYEDTLGNLALNRPSGQQSLLDASDESPLKQARQSYVMNYMLEVESRGSASLLNTAQFLEPTRYQLNVRSAGGDETKAVNVDLLETFNYLLGLRVEHIAAPLHFDAEFSKGEYGRLQAKVNRSPEGPWWFRTVYGKNANGQSVLVVWRNLPSVIAGGDDGMQQDNAVLDAVLIEKLKIRLTESADDEIDILYVNGDHNIAIPRDRKGQAMEQARLQLIEETFHRLMFAGTESVQ
ncbi:MAG: adenine-specific DNA-methyltransferase [Zhongshania aliphaticivorans]|jgi:adenine-specific DNA-methyltransferase